MRGNRFYHSGWDKLTNLSGQALTFNADGNLTSDGLRNYTWDAENRLVGITYPGQSGKATAFSYDGLSRRTAIASTPTGGGGAVTTSYIWCGAGICQARNMSNAVTREYFAEGEYVPGSPSQTYYYGPDQIGSVRRVFASASSAPAYRPRPIRRTQTAPYCRPCDSAFFHPRVVKAVCRRRDEATSEQGCSCGKLLATSPACSSAPP